MISDKDKFEVGDFLVSTVNKKTADEWGVDYPDGQWGPFGYWLQVFRELEVGPNSFEPIARFTSQEAAMEFALASKDQVTVWFEE